MNVNNYILKLSLHYLTTLLIKSNSKPTRKNNNMYSF